MCSSPKAPPAPPPPAPPAPPPPAAVVAPADGERRRDQAALQAGRGRNSLRIDRTQNGMGGSGSGLNIPT